MSARRTFARLHVWLAWIAGVPILFWTASGLWMVARPIEEVRGTALRAEAVPFAGTVPLRMPPGAFRSLTLERQGGSRDGGRIVWVGTNGDGVAIRADAETGRPLPPVGEAEARRLARAALVDAPPILSAVRTSAKAPPADLRRARPAWAVDFRGGTRVYVDADTGQVLALRTDQWRAFDWMWGLHIMDLSGREDTSHPLLIGFAALALLVTLAGLVLLPLRRG